MISIKMVHANFHRLSPFRDDASTLLSIAHQDCGGLRNVWGLFGRILTAATVVTAVFRERTNLFGRTPLKGRRGVGRTTHRATSTHLTGSISKQRMPEQKNHTPDHPKGAHVTNPPASEEETPQIAIFSLPTL